MSDSSLSESALLAHVAARLPRFAPTGEAEPLSGGLLNEVWRVPGRSASVPPSLVAKHAPPHIASQPDVPLDPERITFEARALSVFGEGEALSGLASEAVRPPHMLDFDADAHVLLMEDLGRPPGLGTWLQDGPPEQEVEAVGERLGHFVGRLHARTAGDAAMRAAFDNRAMQETRLAVQYRAIGELCGKTGAEDAAMLGARAEAMGERFVEPGGCLVMGDLWPPSVLLPEENELRLIDWELCHYGRPAQDVAHVTAHFWMLAHRAPTPAARTAAEIAKRAFLGAYRDALDVADAREALLPSRALADCATHFAAEILVRAVGPFQDGYLYDGLAPDATPVREASALAVRHLRVPRAQDTFAALES